MKQKNKEIWDYCYECGKPLTNNMEENEDWFGIRNCGESFPICKCCNEKYENGKLVCPNCKKMYKNCECEN